MMCFGLSIGVMSFGLQSEVKRYWGASLLLEALNWASSVLVVN
jgi:hypothetical protein